MIKHIKRMDNNCHIPDLEQVFWIVEKGGMNLVYSAKHLTCMKVASNSIIFIRMREQNRHNRCNCQNRDAAINTVSQFQSIQIYNKEAQKRKYKIKQPHALLLIYMYVFKINPKDCMARFRVFDVRMYIFLLVFYSLHAISSCNETYLLKATNVRILYLQSLTYPRYWPSVLPMPFTLQLTALSYLYDKKSCPYCLWLYPTTCWLQKSESFIDIYLNCDIHW